MSGGGSSRVSVPIDIQKMIDGIKEITENPSEEEIYAMLKECSMDPNETIQKLLLQDSFHVVTRKHGKRKENPNNKESAESRWRPGGQGRGGRGGRGNSAPRHTSHDAGGGRNSGPGKENGINQAAEKVVTPALQTSQDTKTKDKSPAISSTTVIANGPEVISSSVSINNLGNAPPPDDANKNSVITFGTGDSHRQPTLSSSNFSASTTSSSSSAVCFSPLDPVLVPSNDSRLPGAVGAIKREVGSNRPPGEPNAVVLAENKIAAAAEISSATQGKMSSKSQGVGKNLLAESSQPSSTLTHSGSSVSRPSSNYNNRPQQIISPQKVGPNKEWKPKPTNINVQDSGTAVAPEAPTILVEAAAQAQHDTSVLDMEEATSKLQRKLEELHLPQRQLVILPNHIHVPESERTKLSFGSFGADFGVNTSYVSGPVSDKSSTSLSEISQGIEESVDEQASSNQNALATAEEGDYPDHPQSPTRVPENLSSGDGDVSSSAIPEYTESKQDTTLPSGGHQYSMVHTSPTYGFGFVPPMIGSQLAPVENCESQVRDVSRVPSYIVQQPYDPSYYAQFYRSGADSDGRLSPFANPAAATKYNGNVAVLPPPSSQSPQEGGVLSTAGATPLATQAAGLMQSSIAVTQQPVPVFRPAGVHISHYPPNYIPYGHYYSPFFVPPPLHQYLGNSAFPQQPPAGSVYPAPPPAPATGVKYPLPQYKPGTNTGNPGNPAHMGMPGGYGPYGSPPAGYNPSSAATTGNSTSNEDLNVSQFKENNVYISGQQSEGSAVWVAAPSRDVASLPTSSYYNLPPQGQHVTFTPTQAGHGTFAGVYHPAQAVTAAMLHPIMQQSQTMAGAVDMVGPGGSVYQPTQQAQINWPSNY